MGEKECVICGLECIWINHDVIDDQRISLYLGIESRYWNFV